MASEFGVDLLLSQEKKCGERRKKSVEQPNAYTKYRDVGSGTPAPPLPAPRLCTELPKLSRQTV
jgi:hypothetical protein